MEIIPEALELAEFYKSMLDPDDVRKIVVQQNLNHGRFGLRKIEGSIDEQLVINQYWRHIKNSKGKLREEGRFVENTLKTDLVTPIERGFERAKFVLPKKEYTDPSVVITAGFPSTDARVIVKGKEFGINLSNPWVNCDFDMNKFLLALESYSAHEGDHIYLEQLSIPRKHETIRDDAQNVMFGEGLATYAELPEVLKTRDTHTDCMKNIDYWEDAIERCLKCKPQDRGKMLREISYNLALAKGDSERCNRIMGMAKSPEGREIPLSEYKQELENLLVKCNGPEYHAGYKMWKTIGERYGIEKVRETVSKGPEEFFNVYKKAKKK
jgi:hypothetical protein